MIATNILKGIKKRLTREKAVKNFPTLSWAQVKLLKHQDDQQLKRIRVGNLDIHYRKPYELMHTYAELFEEEIYRFNAGNPSPFIVDCGANIGLSVLYFKQIYPQSSIVAFEPDASNFSILEENCKANGIRDVQLEQAAVWIEDTTLQFVSSGSQGSHINTQGPGEHTIQVRAVKLSNLLQSRKIDFLKIDIEGAEDHLLRDCASSLGNVDQLFVEYHGKVNETEKLTGILTIMQKAGFQVYIKLAADHLAHPFTEKHTGYSFDVQLNLFGYRNQTKG